MKNEATFFNAKRHVPAEETFLAKFRTNSSKETLATTPGKSNTIMPWSFYGNMTDHDLKSIYTYLRTLKPVSNKIVKWEN